MSGEHVIGRCRWQSRFDQQEGAVALQDWLSQWSNDTLAGVLQEVLDSGCPAGHTVRIDSLELHLGEIALEVLEEELPRRLRTAMAEALAARHTQGPGPLQGDAQYLEPGQGPCAQIAWYLRHGNLPWWGAQPRDVGAAFDELLASQPEAMAQLLRELGRSEAVRRRIVWQLGGGRVRAILRLLEPLHAELIGEHAEQLCDVQARRQLPVASARAFGEQLWMDILTWLLVDRGSLFNTTTFVGDLLRRTARHYGIAEQDLLEQMYQGVQALRPLGIVRPTLFTAIETLRHQAQHGQALAPPAPTAYPAPWQDWQAMLRNGQGQRRVQGRSVRYGELFEALARQDAGRMTAALYKAGTAASVRQGLLRHLDAARLGLLVQLLAPRDHLFILAHVTHTERCMQLRQWDAKAVWQLLLAFLLLARGSRFERRQLVRDTLQGLARQFACPLPVLLGQLVESLAQGHPDPQRFELLGILCQLQGEAHAYPAPRQQWRWRLLDHLRGERAGQALPTAWRQGLVSLLDGGGAAPGQWLRELLASPALAQVSDRLLSERLLALLGGAAWPRLVALIEGQALGVCQGILGELDEGQRRGYLPSLAGFDLAWRLPALLLQALFGMGLRGRGGTRFDALRLWRRLMALLRGEGRVDTQALQRELQAWRLVEPLWGQAPSAGWRAPLATGSSAGSAPVVAGHRLLRLLAGDPGMDLSAWTERQPERQQALYWLIEQAHLAPVARWSAGLLPAGLKPAQGIIRTWVGLLAGCWQGAEALLEQQLAQVFWAVAFDARGQHLDAARLLARMAVCASQRLDIPLARMLEAWHTALPGLAYSPWHGAHAWLVQRPQVRPGPGTGRFIQDHAGRYLQDARLAEITRHLLWHGHPPAWLEGPRAVDLARLLHDVLQARRDLLSRLFEGISAHPAAWQRLCHHVPFSWLLEALHGQAPERNELWQHCAALHQALAGMSLPGTDREQRTRGLYQWVLRHALARNWAALAPAALIDAVLSQLLREHRLQPATLVPVLAARLDAAAQPLRQAVARLAPPAPTAPPVAPARPRNPYPQPVHEETTMLHVPNAGLVIGQTYLPMLFARVGLTEQRAFPNQAAQLRAVQYLHYVSTGHTETPETHATLNKLLCGVAQETPIEALFEPTEQEKEMAESMIKGIVMQWRALGQSSVDGYRGNFILRQGMLEEQENRWQLRVERRPYDVLINRAPFTFSIIKFPWMPKALSVDWPY